MRTQLILFLSVFLASCATQFQIDVFPKDASIELLNAGNPDTQGKTVGKGKVEVETSTATNEIYKIASPGYESIYLYVAPKESGFVMVKLNQLNEMQKIIELEGKVNAADRSVKGLQEEIGKNRSFLNLVARAMSNSQRALSRGSAKEADHALQDIFSGEKGGFVPAAAYTLRGKIYLMKGEKEKAISDFKTALRISSDENEASILLRNIGK